MTRKSLFLRRTVLPLLLAFGALGAVQAIAADLKPCHPPGMRDAAQCGVLKRPLNPSEPNGKQIDVHYVVVASMAREKHPDPVFFFAGGPGQSAIDVLPAIIGSLKRLNNRRDIVFVDQRGTGTSAPLQCAPDASVPLRESMDPQLLAKRMERCRLALEKLPYGDLRFFTTSIAMGDIDAVRAALGAETINLIGGSYGTRAALEYMRLYPQRVRRVVLDGVVPPDLSLPQSISEDANSALKALFADCAADKACNANYPNLAQTWESLFDRLPATMLMDNPVTGTPEQVTITAPMIGLMVRGPLYAPNMASALPRAIAEAAQGRWGAMMGLASASGNRSGKEMAMGMHFSTLCAEDALRPVSLESAGRFSNAMELSYKAVCADWPKGQVDPAFYVTPKTTSPVMMLSGGIDPVTPPQHAQKTAKLLGDTVEHIIVPKAGHGLLRLGCVRDLVFRFVDSKAPPVPDPKKADCLATIPRPMAFVPMAVQMRGAK